MTPADDKTFLPGCTVLPPMEGSGEQLDREPENPTNLNDTMRRGQSGRFAVLNAFVDVSARELTRSESLVWLVLYRDTKPDGLARTSQANLARRVGVNVSTVKRAVAALRHRGLLVVAHQGGLRGGPSAYQVVPISSKGYPNRSIAIQPVLECGKSR